MGLEYRKKAYKRRGESRGYGDTVRLLNIMKKEKPWIGEAYSQSLQSSLRNLDVSFINFLRDPEHFGYPKFKKKSGRQSLQYPQGCKVDFQEQKLYVPKIGRVPCIFHRRFKGKMKTVTVSIEPSGEFYVSILVENEDKTPVVIQQSVNDESDVLGIDMGLTERCLRTTGIWQSPKRSSGENRSDFQERRKDQPSSCHKRGCEPYKESWRCLHH